jgi:LCP family protein required for cell wall assembly
LIATLLTVPFLAVGCSDDEKPKSQPTRTTTPSTTPPPPPPQPKVTGKGLPPDLLKAVGALYLGGDVAATSSTAKALAKRKLAKASLQVGGSTGSWKGTPIAVVTRGKDVTLLVGGKRWTVVGGWWPSLGVARVPVKPMRVLAIGSDARSGQRVEACRADALQLIGVDSKGVGGIVGIPRDSYVSVAGGGPNKINAALALKGVKAQVRTVEDATGLPIDGYVMTGFKGFRAMITAVGGITFVSKDSLRSVDNFQILRPGKNRLTSKTALALARERKHLSNGDFGRSANQGRLIKAGVVMARAKGAGYLPRYLKAMSPHLTTDLSAEQVLNLCSSIYLSNPAGMRTSVATGGIGTRNGQSVVLLGGGARSLFADIKDGRLGG